MRMKHLLYLILSTFGIFLIVFQNCVPVNLKISEGLLDTKSISCLKPPVIKMSPETNQAILPNTNIQFEIINAELFFDTEWTLPDRTKSNLNLLNYTFTHLGNNELLFKYKFKNQPSLICPQEGSQLINILVADTCPALSLVKINGPSKSTVNSVNNFSLSGFDNCQNISSFEWKMGDGQIYNSQNINHAFLNPGTYNIELKLTTTDFKIHVIRHIIEISSPEIYVWKKTGESACSVSECGKVGTKNIYYDCQNQVTSVKVLDSFCTEIRPAPTENCASAPCNSCTLELNTGSTVINHNSSIDLYLLSSATSQIECENSKISCSCNNGVISPGTNFCKYNTCNFTVVRFGA